MMAMHQDFHKMDVAKQIISRRYTCVFTFIRAGMLFIFVLLIITRSYGQTGTPKQIGINHNVWFSQTTVLQFNDRFSLQLETNLRRSNGLSNPQQSLLRSGFNFQLNKQVSVAAGYAYIDTSPYGVFPSAAPFTEDRLWEQVQIRTSIQRLEWVSRLRLEQRFNYPPIKQADGSFATGPSVYTNRFRLMNRLSLPLNKKVFQPGTFYLTTFDELMVNTGKNVALNVFDQNRFFTGTGYIIKGVGRLELGYLLQTIQKADGVRMERNQTILLSLTTTIPVKHKA